MPTNTQPILQNKIESLPNAFSELRNFNQFIVYVLSPSKNRPGKNDKLPINFRTGQVANAHDQNIWTDADTAIETAISLGPKYGLGFVLTKSDPFWFLDIDNCLEPSGSWSSLAISLCNIFQGAAIEVSSSGQGLHILGTGNAPSHSCKNSTHNLEFYTSGRFVALTGIHATGSINHDCSQMLPWLIDNYFRPNEKVIALFSDKWSTNPCTNWSGPVDDMELITRALASQSARTIFGKSATFKDLWEANDDKLAIAYPDKFSNRAYDESSADAALAQHLAFWTGNNCERMERLMRQSMLFREKWQRKDYLRRTILNACSRQTEWFNDKSQRVVETRLANQSNPAEPLPNLPDVLAFDYKYLPNVMREYVKDISERMQCPPDFPALASIVMIAGLLGRKIGIRPKLKDDWTIIPNIWGAIVGNSGIKKSPALGSALKPIKNLQATAFEIFDKEKIEYDNQLELAKIELAVKKTKAKETLKKDQSIDIKEFLKSSPNLSTPILRRYITNNATYEKLGEILVENPNGVLVEYDEIIGLLKQLDASGQEVARSFYLSGANGDTPCTFDRIARGTLHIPAVCLSIIGGIQPGVLAEYVRQAVGGGAGADGLLQRFGLIVYPDIASECDYIDRYPNNEAREAMNQLVEKIDNLNIDAIGAITDPYSNVSFLHFNDDAQILYAEWSISLEKRLRSNEEHPAIISHLAKYSKLIPSLSLIYHLCDNKIGPVSKDALERAIMFSEYLESHAKRIYSYATRPDIDAARTILKRLANGKLSNPFRARDLSQKGWTGLETPSKAQAAIDLLVEYRHLSEEEVATGGRPTKYYHWFSTT